MARMISTGLAVAAAMLTLSAHAEPALGAFLADAGDAVVVSGPGKAGSPLREGGSATAFSFRLPRGASCQRDSAEGGYRVQSYMVPARDDPGSLVYTDAGPDGPGRFPLYDVTTSQFVNQQTANADAPGQPGTIVNLPAFSYAVYAPGELPPGRYNIGVACSLLNKTTRFWNVETVVTSARGDKPAQVRWTVPAAPATPSRSGLPSAGVLVGATLVIVLVGAGLARRCHRSGRLQRPLTTPLEDR